MPRTLKLYITGVVAASALALAVTTLLFRDAVTQLPVRGDIAAGIPRVAADELRVPLGLLFWTCVTLFASAFPVRMPRGTVVGVSIAPIVAVMALGGPVAAGWIALVGTTELREIRGKI